MSLGREVLSKNTVIPIHVLTGTCQWSCDFETTDHKWGLHVKDKIFQMRES